MVLSEHNPCLSCFNFELKVVPEKNIHKTYATVLENKLQTIVNYHPELSLLVLITVGE